MKKMFIATLLGSMFLALFSSVYVNFACAAGPFSVIWNKYLNKNDNRTVVVVFHTEGNVDAASTKMINLMKTRDPGGFMNPYWIVDIPDKDINRKTKCGIVAGTWYSSGFPARSQWFRVMQQADNFTDLYALMYSTDDGFKPISEHQENAKTLMDICND